jgi:hypothetical protein
MRRSKANTLVKFDVEKIRSWSPCYDPTKYVSKNWRGTVLDVLALSKVPPRDRFWVVCREELLDAGLLRRFVVAQAKTCRKYVKDKKEFDRILKVCLRYADGKATDDELAAARSAAYAASSAARSAAKSTAYSLAIKMLSKMIKKEYSR